MLKAIEIAHCQAGSVTSRSDGSVKISFVTPELRPSEGGALLLLHGNNVCVSIVPEDVVPEETIHVDTMRENKTPSQRLRAVLFVSFTNERPAGQMFAQYYEEKMEQIIDGVKRTLP